MKVPRQPTLEYSQPDVLLPFAYLLPILVGTFGNVAAAFMHGRSQFDWALFQGGRYLSRSRPSSATRTFRSRCFQPNTSTALPPASSAIIKSLNLTVCESQRWE